MAETIPTDLIQHDGEHQSNEVRKRVQREEPNALRTFTPSLAVISRSAGSYHWTPEGRKLADFSSGVLVANLGHNPTAWWRAVLKYLQLENLDSPNPFIEAAPLTAYNAITEVEAEATSRLLANLQGETGGSRMQQVMWAASGSEAIQKSLWAAMRFKPGRDMLIATRHGFHGKKGLAGAITGSEDDKERDDRVRFISFPMQECQDLVDRREPLDLGLYQAELDQLLSQHGDRLAAVVTEPYLGGGGSYHPQAEYMQLLEKFCRDNGLLFILDEIQSNFGRTGPMYAFTHYGVEPDIVCLGKGLGNGVPVSAAVGRADVFGSLGFGEGSDTWSANPVSSAAVLATLDAFENQPVLEQGLALSALIEEKLVELKQTRVIARVRGEGCVWGIECADLGELPAGDVADLVIEGCYRGDHEGRGIHLLGSLAGKVIRISPPLTMPLDEAAEYLDLLHQICDQLGEARG
jgi:4-aminobutyrate aminotransferase-like enzyme